MHHIVKALLHNRNLAFQLFGDNLPVVGVKGADVDAAHKGDFVPIELMEL